MTLKFGILVQVLHGHSRPFSWGSTQIFLFCLVLNLWEEENIKDPL